MRWTGLFLAGPDRAELRQAGPEWVGGAGLGHTRPGSAGMGRESWEMLEMLVNLVEFDAFCKK